MPPWKIVLVIAVCVLSVLYSLPNALPQEARQWMQTSLPSWMPGKTVNLGLDLQGGSHLLLEVDVSAVVRERADSLVQAARPELRSAKIGYSGIAALPDGIRITLRDGQAPEAVKKILRGVDDHDLEIREAENNTVEGRLTEDALRKITDQTISQSIEIVRRRVDETGTREPVITRQGENRIVVQLPGLDDPQRIKDLLGKTAQLTFHLVPEDPDAARGTMSLPMAENPAQKMSVFRKSIMTGDMLTNAQTAFQQGQTVVSFRLDAIGARRFCKTTEENIGRPFAIVLDRQIISAPVIRDAICGGAGIISGGFTVETASDLALLLRAGALPAPLSVLEERTVGPSLGADSIASGKEAALIALALVLVFMLFMYRRFGIYASIALLFNVTLIFAALSILQATLTLPGIAGIVLTIGMAVDANVLIFERIREERKAGRSVMPAIDAGYARARATIVDANLTTLIAAIILYSFGSGPVKGFAVTLTIGIITSLFAAVMVTRLMVLFWLRRNKPSELPL